MYRSMQRPIWAWAEGCKLSCLRSGAVRAGEGDTREGPGHRDTAPVTRVLPVAAASSAPSWGALAGALVVVIVFYWLLPRVVFPRLAARRTRPSLLEDRDPRRWTTTVAAGLAAYVAVGVVLGAAPLGMVIWGIAFLAIMAIAYRRSG